MRPVRLAPWRLLSDHQDPRSLWSWVSLSFTCPSPFDSLDDNARGQDADVPKRQLWRKKKPSIRTSDRRLRSLSCRHFVVSNSGIYKRCVGSKSIHFCDIPRNSDKNV